MTALTLDLFRPSILDPIDEDAEPVVRVTRASGASRTNASQSGGGLTLDDLLVGVWEGLSAHRTVACPACGGAMTPRYGAGPAPVGGRCRSCGTTIE
jgi:tRNA(Ile2) C34 agmatinyltransferase TiaS